MAKRPWFKHYNTASQGDTIRQWIATKDYECVVLFWILLEFLSRNESEERCGKATVKIDFLAKEMNMKPTKCRRVLARISSVSQMRFEGDINEELTFRVGNWLEFQEYRGKKKTENVQKSRTEVRGKKKEERGKNREESAKASQPTFGRTLDVGELDRFIKNLQQNLNTSKPITRHIALKFLACFASLGAAEDFLADVFERAQAKFPDDDGKQLGYLHGAMHNHAVAEKLAAQDGH